MMDNKPSLSADQLKSMSVVDIEANMPDIEGDKITAEEYRSLLAHVITTRPEEVRFTYEGDGVKRDHALHSIFIRAIASTLMKGVPEDLRMLQRDVFGNQETRAAIAGEGTELKKQFRLISFDAMSSHLSKVIENTEGSVE